MRIIDLSGLGGFVAVCLIVVLINVMFAPSRTATAQVQIPPRAEHAVSAQPSYQPRHKPAPVAIENAECTKFYNNALRLAQEGDLVPPQANVQLRKAKYLGATAYSSLYQACKVKWGEMNAR